MTTASPATGVVGDDGVEHLDVVVVGAGLSGVCAGHYLQAECPWASYAIVEARAAIGGTWDLFRYPGIRSDSDMFTLGYAFAPWKHEEAIAQGADILAYINETAAAEGIDGHIRYHHAVTRADWSSERARWEVTVERGDTGETVVLTADFLLGCTGYYRYDQGYTPDFPGLADFSGTVVHPQFWPDDLDYAGKQVVVIGSGATAVTLVPALAERAGHVTMLQRSPTYIASLPARDPVARLARRLLPARWSGPALRWFKALFTQGSYALSKSRPELMKKILRKGIERQLPAGYDIDTHFTPRYNPWDQRLCVVPNGDLFKAIRRGTVSVATDTIDTFTQTGITLSSGAQLDADVVITATGLDLVFAGGIAMTVDGEPVELHDKMVYKGMMLEGVPNLCIAVGYTNASWTLKCELTCQYAVRLLNHLRATGRSVCRPVNNDPALVAQPLLSLQSGYIQRSALHFPLQGSRAPWMVHQSYLADYRALKRSNVEDEAMQFTQRSESAELVGAS